MPLDRLPDAELDVLSALWRSGEATVRELRASLDATRPMTHGALFTLLRRLEKKGLVVRRKGSVGKAFVYRSRPRPDPSYKKLARRLVERVFGGDRLKLVAALLETRAPSDAELDALQRLIARHRRRRDGGPS